MKLTGRLFLISIITATVFSCSPKGPGGLLAKKTDREKYAERIKIGSGMSNPAVNAWLAAGDYVINYPLGVSNNYAENGAFSPNTSGAHAVFTELKKGMKLSVSLIRGNPINTKVYMDLWLAPDSSTARPRRFIGAADTATNIMNYIAYADEKLIIRFQKEVGNTGAYQFSLQSGPSFIFPVRADAKTNIGSLWGDPRDGGARSHEGIDIFAPRRAAVVAVADGLISEVSEDPIGGKVIFLRPRGSKIRAYYAHLDTQLVEEDRQVSAGDVIGLVGNTGNAVTTVPHLHFGIYDNAGAAMDPLLFVKPVKNISKKVPAFPGKTEMITVKNAMVYNDILINSYFVILPKNTPVNIEAATENHYKVLLADGRKGFIVKGDLK